MTRPVTHNNQVKLHDRKCYIQRQVSSRTDSRIHFVLGKECKSKVRVLMIDGHVLRTSSPRKSICAKVQSSCIVWSSKGTIPSQSHFQLLNHQVTIIRAQKYLGTLTDLKSKDDHIGVLAFRVKDIWLREDTWITICHGKHILI